MRLTVFLVIALIIASCGYNKITKTYQNDLEGFNNFAKDFEILITDSAQVQAINKSKLSYAELETINFIDTNGLIGRRTSLNEDNIYELSSDFEFNAGEEVFESAIIYYFKYDSTSNGFVIVNMMMAG